MVTKEPFEKLMHLMDGIWGGSRYKEQTSLGPNKSISECQRPDQDSGLSQECSPNTFALISWSTSICKAGPYPLRQGHLCPQSLGEWSYGGVSTIVIWIGAVLEAQSQTFFTLLTICK